MSSTVCGLPPCIFLILFHYILGQLASSMLIDHFGLIQMPVRPVHWWKLLGMALMLGGVALFVFGER